MNIQAAPAVSCTRGCWSFVVVATSRRNHRIKKSIRSALGDHRGSRNAIEDARSPRISRTLYRLLARLRSLCQIKFNDIVDRPPELPKLKLKYTSPALNRKPWERNGALCERGARMHVRMLPRTSRMYRWHH
jgi:hypothetical protein